MAVIKTFDDISISGDSYIQGLLDQLGNVTILDFTYGGYINADGTTVDVSSVTASSGYCYAVADCQEGDVILFCGSGASKPRLYTFIDSAGVVLAKSSSAQTETKLVMRKAPAGSAKVIIQSRVSNDHYALKNMRLTEYELDVTKRQLIPYGADLNSLTSAGTFYVESNNHFRSLSNTPPTTLAGVLVVMNLGSATTAWQTYHVLGNVFTRTYISSSGWGEWERVAYSDDVLSLEWSDRTVIPSGSDLNAYVSAGNYAVNSSSAAGSIQNMPIGTGGILTVLTTYASGVVLQLYATSFGMYFRSLSGGSWQDWLPIAPSAMLNGTQSKVVDDGTDFDSLGIGDYLVTSINSASTMENIPTVYPGRLIVYTIGGALTMAQAYITSNGNFYYRNLMNGAFSDWKKAVFDNEVSQESQDMLESTAYRVRELMKNADPYSINYANAFEPMTLENYVGNTQNVHPKVLYFENGFGGHKWWMAYTPYPNSNDNFENPCIAYSDDGVKWSNIASNPIDNPNGDGYDSDTHLVWNGSTLECWFRHVDDTSQESRNETIYRMTSSNGTSWGNKEEVYVNSTGDYVQLLSPAIIYDNGTYHIWVVNRNGIVYYTAPSDNISNWTKQRELSINFVDDGMHVNPWHIDVIKDVVTGKYAILAMCRNGVAANTAKWSLFIAESSDNVTYTTPKKVVGGSDGWDRFMYRSSIVQADGKYIIYYSANSGGSPNVSNNAIWGMGVTESDTLGNFIGRVK